MKIGQCWCNEKEPVEILFDKNHDLVYALDGQNAFIRIRVSPEQGRVGLPIDFCPYCGRQLADGNPRCPQKESA